MRFRRILALDCGAAHVACGLFLRAAGGRLVLERFATAALPLQEPSDDEWVAAVVTSLEALGRQERLRGACVLGLPGHLTFAKLIRVPDTAARPQRKIVRFEARQSLPSALHEVAWTAAALAGNGNGRDVALTAVRRSVIEALCVRLSDAGFTPWAVLPPWFVLRHGAGGAGPPGAEPALVLCVGARSTHLVLSDAMRFFMRTFALGGNAVTQRVADELGLDYARAESLKRQVFDRKANMAAESPERTAVAIAADEFVRRVGGEIARSLASLFPEGGDRRPGVLSLTGNGSLIPELAPALAERLQMRIERWEARRHIGLGLAVAESSGGPDLAALAGLSGLAAGATSREAAAVNLLPRAWRWGMRIRRWWPGVATAAALVVLALATAAWQTRVKTGAIREETAEIDRKIDILRGLERRNHDNLARLAATNRRIAALRRLADARSAWIAFLSDLQERLVKTEDVWLERLRIPPPAPRMASAAPTAGTAGLGLVAQGGRTERQEAAPAAQLELAGYLFDASNPVALAGETTRARASSLLAQLRASPFVAGIEAERFDSSRPGLLRFELTLTLAPRSLF